MSERIYVEWRFHGGLVLSGYIDQDEATDMLRNNAAPSQSPAEGVPIFGTRHAVLLQDQRVATYQFGNPSPEAIAFHQKK